jgi:ABC-type multidrug transport system ATPase subunit
MMEDREQIQTLLLKGRAIVTIGRDPDNTVVLDDIMASRWHARIQYLEAEGAYAIEDLHSTNGTYINGNSITKQYILRDGDIIRIGSNKFTFAPGHLERVNESSGIRLDAINLNQYIGQNKNILQNISLSIAPREFTAVVGVSGAGKSTLLAALNGFKPANRGKVFINGSDLYRNFNSHRSQLGYVPQQDIIHYELTVFEALKYAAKLRLPGDTKQESRYKRIIEVIETLNLSEQRDLQISKLSGGQRKRVSIGVELLTKPGLFFLDEATSGLDPGMESEMMRLLRLLADQGHTIIIVTHATRNVNRCDEVAFLAKGGHLAYYGPPEQALHYFGVSEFDDIYVKLEKESSPGEWAKKYRESPQYKQFISQRLSPEYGSKVETDSGKKAVRLAQGSSQKRFSLLSQLLTLSQRNLNVLLRDKVSLLLMLLIAPLISILFAPFWRHNLLSTSLGDAELVITNLFIAAIVCCLTGSIAFIREIVKEADIYKRERMVALNIIPYVLSKVFMAVILSLYQAAIFLSFFIIFGGWPQASDAMIQVYITLFLATLAGAFQGLLISAIAPNQNVAPLLIIIILVLQLVFGGILPQRDRGVVVNQINYIGGSITSTKWAFESLLTISGLGRCVADDDCWQLTDNQRNALTEEYKLSNCDCTGTNIFSRCTFPGINEYYNKAVDEPEPVKPAKPDKPPSQPKRPGEPDINAYVSGGQYAEDNRQYKEDMLIWSDEMEKYKATLDSYESDMNKYDKAVTEYTDIYKEWRKGRDQAVGKAEGIIKTVKQNYGQGFNVDIYSHWRSLGYIMLILFIFLAAIQKLKDRI